VRLLVEVISSLFLSDNDVPVIDYDQDEIGREFETADNAYPKALPYAPKLTKI